MDKYNTDESKVYREEISWSLLCWCLWERDLVISVILDSHSDKDTFKSAVLVHSRLLKFYFFAPNSYKSLGAVVLFRSQMKCWSPAFPLPPFSTPFPVTCMACTILFCPKGLQHTQPATLNGVEESDWVPSKNLCLLPMWSFLEYSSR